MLYVSMCREGNSQRPVKCCVPVYAMLVYKAAAHWECVLFSQQHLCICIQPVLVCICLQELPAVLSAHFASLDTTTASIMGHSMGGHGALTIALKNPGKYKSLSAFAPICNPCNVPWGIKAFTGYFGAQQLVLTCCCESCAGTCHQRTGFCLQCTAIWLDQVQRVVICCAFCQSSFT